MTHDILLNILANGYQYSHTDDKGELHHVVVTPNKYMIKAAELIKHLAAQLNSNQAYINQITRERDGYYQELETLRKERQNEK